MKPASAAVRIALGLALVAVSPVAGLAPAQAGEPAMLPAAAAAPFDVAARLAQAPFGDRMPAIVRNYLRAAPYVGTGGLVAEGAYPQLKELGFRTVINLLTAEEGAAHEAAAAAQAGIAYVDMPVPTLAPRPDQVAAFAALVGDSANYPILVHCQTANRAGAMWALYRAGLGVPGEIAIQEGRTVGLMPSREGAVRRMLSLPDVN